MLTRIKQQAFPIAAVFLLFIIQFFFFFVEADFVFEDRLFATVELAFFFVLFTFSLLDVIIPEMILTILGCAALCVLRGHLLGYSAINTTVFFAHLPICIFMLVQDLIAKKTRQSFGFILTGVYPTLFLGFLIWYMISFPITAKHILESGVNYGCFTFPALIILYGVIRRIPISKKMTEKQVRDTQRNCFLFAMLTMGETFFMLRIFNAPSLNFTVSLFWFTAIAILYRKGNPLMCAFMEHLGFRPEST